jgi:hypothetical protein
VPALDCISICTKAASLRDEKLRLAAEAGQAHDLRNDRTRLAAEAEALRHTLAQHKMQAAASSAELSVRLQSTWCAVRIPHLAPHPARRHLGDGRTRHNSLDCLLQRAVEAARDAEHRAGRERLASALAAERRMRSAEDAVPNDPRCSTCMSLI